MLSYHNIDVLDGKVSSSILNKYKMDYKNLTLTSIVAGFHRFFGLRDEGNMMSLEIINTIKDDADSLVERNILVWNLYILSKEYIDNAMYEEAMSIIERAERNWTRDVILGDEVGVYHISWIEQLLLKKAEIYMLINDTKCFQRITDTILLNRFSYFKKAYNFTGESILKDRCTYNCFELMAFESRKKNISLAINMIKQAISYRKGSCLGENLNLRVASVKEENGNLFKAFDLYLKHYYKLPEASFDSIGYGYCKTCAFFNGNRCYKKEVFVEDFKACSKYEFKK
jgi:hypothetical protein